MAFGVMAFAWPGLTVLTLVLLYAAHAILDGATALGLAFSGHVPGRAWWPMVLVGIVGILAGIGTFAWPGITAAILLAFVHQTLSHALYALVAVMWFIPDRRIEKLPA